MSLTDSAHPPTSPVRTSGSEPAVTAFGSSPRPWEASTLRLARTDAALLQTLGAGPQAGACLILHERLDDGADGDDEQGPGRRFTLELRRMLLGRSADCEIRIEHASISRCHAEIAPEDGAFVLRDRGSSNGTRVNSTQIHGAVKLTDGDVVRLGSVALKFHAHQSLDALMHDRLYKLATVDAATEVHSKRYLMDALGREIRRARRSKSALSLVCLDLDHFKLVNDRFGHGAGDLVLRSTAALAKALVRGSDVLGRIGGEEFAVLLPETALTSAVELAERMRSAIASQLYPLELVDEQGSRTVLHRQTASFGVAELLSEMPDARSLLGAAERMLYTAKRSGRNCVGS